MLHLHLDRFDYHVLFDDSCITEVDYPHKKSPLRHCVKGGVHKLEIKDVALTQILQEVDLGQTL